jgi:O-antigen/teichoic acid export membrane protein
MTTVAPSPGFRKALYLMASTSLLVPLAGIVTSPILAQALGVAGRGEVAAAISPNVLIVSVATLGLPEALTYFLAKFPRGTRNALGWATLFGLSMGVLCFAVAWFALPFLSNGDRSLANLILLATALAVPLLVVNLLRGAASGRQMWRAVALEKTSQSVIRVGALVVLALTGHLTVLTATAVMTIGPIIAGLVYWKLLRKPPLEGEPFPPKMPKVLMDFGSKIWLGSVSSMLLARLGQILFTPLSNVSELGLYVTAVSISDVPLIFAIAIRDVLFSVNSKSNDAKQLTTSARLTLIIGILTCIVLGGTLPFWIAFIFGSSFVPAVLPTWILMASALVSIPGFMAGAGLGAWGRPALRSVGLVLGLIANLVVFVALVPHFGAVGASIAALASSIASTAFVVIMAARVIGVPIHEFWVIRGADFAKLYNEVMSVLRSRVPFLRK